MPSALIKRLVATAQAADALPNTPIRIALVVTYVTAIAVVIFTL